MPCSARSSRARTWSTASKRSRPAARASTTTCRRTTWSSRKPSSPDAVAGAAAPTFDRVEAGPQWRTVDFISDLHLQPAEPATFAAWRAYMQGTPADAVFILGDLFEAWIGDDAALQP